MTCGSRPTRAKSERRRLWRSYSFGHAAPSRLLSSAPPIFRRLVICILWSGSSQKSTDLHRNILATDMFGLCDPFCVVVLAEQRVRTKHIRPHPLPTFRFGPSNDIGAAFSKSADRPAGWPRYAPRRAACAQGTDGGSAGRRWSRCGTSRSRSISLMAEAWPGPSSPATPPPRS